MEDNILKVYTKINSNYNNILIEIMRDLKQITNNKKEHEVFKRLGDIILKINNFVKENKINAEKLKNEISN